MTLKTSEDSSFAAVRLLKASAKGAPLGIAAALISALISSAVLLRLPDPMGPMGIFAVGALYIGAFVSSLIPALLVRDCSFAAAITGEGLYCLAVFTASLFMRDPACMSSAAATSAGYGGCAAIALLSGLIARPRSGSVGAKKKSPAALRRAKIGRRR